MKLGQKNLVYSLGLAGMILLFLVGYFSYMLPSLYVDYCTDQNVKSVRRQHEVYMEKGTYEGVQVKNATACYSIDIPLKGNCLGITGKVFSVEIELREEQLIRILENFKSDLAKYWQEGKEPDRGSEESGEIVASEQLQEELSVVFQELFQEGIGLPFDVRVLYSQDIQEEYFHETVKIHEFSDTMAVVEAGVEDAENRYTTYMVMEQAGDRVVLSILPTMTPDMNEIRPIVFQSLPMMGAVLILVVLLFSRMYSRGIVAPIVELSAHADQMKYARNFSVEKLAGKWEERQDEIKDLADTLEDFYDRIRQGYRQLEEKNQELKVENERQEVFLRASAHQLKTPVAAALLLTDGMIQKVGRYQDTETVLPRVKEQLLSMGKIVEEILYLNRCARETQLQDLEVRGLLQELLQVWEPVVTKKQLTVVFVGNDEMEICTDERMFSQIVDNLLSNAVKYTPVGGHIEIKICRVERKIVIENFGVAIPEALLPHIFDPFVGGNHEILPQDTPSHGLGLYIASYFAKKLGILLSVTNGGRQGEMDDLKPGRMKGDGAEENNMEHIRNGNSTAENREALERVVAMLLFDGESCIKDS